MSSLPSTSSYISAASESVTFLIKADTRTTPELKAFHIGSSTGFESTMAEQISTQTEDDNDSPRGVSLLPPFVLSQLALLRRQVIVEKVHCLSDSTLLVSLSSDRLRLLNEHGSAQTYKRHARSAVLSFAFPIPLSNGGIVFGGVNLSRRACLQVQRAKCTKDMMDTLSSGPDVECSSQSVYSTFPSTSSQSDHPSDFSRSFYSMEGNQLRIVTPLTARDDETTTRLCLITVDVDSGVSTETVVTLDRKVPDDLWRLSRRGKTVTVWRHIIVGMIGTELWTVDMQSGIVKCRQNIDPILSLCSTPNGRLVLYKEDSPFPSSLFLTSPSLSTIARDTCLRSLKYPLRQSLRDSGYSADARCIVATVLSL